MGIDVFAKAWSVIPPITAQPVRGHPLCPRHGFLFNNGAIQDIVLNVRGASAGSTAGTFSTSSVRRAPGICREHTATTDFDQLGLDSLLLPTQDCSIVLGYEKTDATLRASVAFGTEGVAGNAPSIAASFVPASRRSLWATIA